MQELRRIRKERGLTQRGLADASGVDPATISLIETGKRRPHLETLDSLALVLGVEVIEFFPKVQASLWPEEEPERRTEVEAWATYVLRRASRIGEHAEDPDSPVFRDARTAMFFIEETHRESTDLIRTISEHAPRASLPFDGAPLDGLLDAFKELGIATGQAEAIAGVMKAATPEDVVAQRRAAKAAKENEEEMERLSEVLNRHAS